MSSHHTEVAVLREKQFVTRGQQKQIQQAANHTVARGIHSHVFYRKVLYGHHPSRKRRIELPENARTITGDKDSNFLQRESNPSLQHRLDCIHSLLRHERRFVVPTHVVSSNADVDANHPIRKKLALVGRKKALEYGRRTEHVGNAQIVPHILPVGIPNEAHFVTESHPSQLLLVRFEAKQVVRKDMVG